MPEQYKPTLKELRVSRGLSQLELATSLGITKQRYSRMEKDPDKISISMLRDILKILNYSASIFFE